MNLLSRCAQTTRNLPQIERAAELADELMATNPHVPEYLALKAATLCKFAETHMHWRDLEGAADAYHTALAFQRKLVDRFPTVLLYRLTAARTLQRLSEIKLKQRDRESAVAHLEEAISALRYALRPRTSITHAAAYDPALASSSISYRRLKCIRQIAASSMTGSSETGSGTDVNVADSPKRIDSWTKSSKSTMPFPLVSPLAQPPV